MTRILAPGRAARQPVRRPVRQEPAQPCPLGSWALPAPLGMPPLLKPVCLAVLLAAAPEGWALPQGGVAVSGQVALRSPQPSTLEILQTSAKAGLDWRSFSIAAGERVLIRQPDAASVLFNRVLGADPSLIFGQLRANGRVFLSNPRGIIFGAGSQVDVGSLVATTLAVNTTALANGNYQLSGATAETGELRADGEIRAPGGTVALVSPRLSVGGNVLAGRVGLAAVGAVQLDVDGDGLIFFNARNDQLDARLSLLPSAELRGGSAELRAVARSGFADTVLNLEGVVRARGLGLRGGQIVLDGGADGITRVSGTLDASGNAAGERGGDIVVLGQKIGLMPTARLDASGSTAGGSILVGGDFQGKNPDLRNAEKVTVLGGARLVADATGQGDGGRVVVWSDKATRFKGDISARGAARGGDGGNVEVSGKDFLDFSGGVDLAAPLGRAGTLLLDPTNIEIVALAANANINADGTLADDIDNTGGAGGTPILAFAAAGTNSKISAPGLVTQLGRGAVELQASSDILVSAGVSSAAGNLLTLKAGGNISVAAGLSVSGGITLSAHDPGGTATPTGHVVLTANLDAGPTGTLTITNNGGATAHSLGGNLTGGTFAITGDVALTQSAAWTVNSAGPSVMAGQISGVGFGLSKAGAGNGRQDAAQRGHAQRAVQDARLAGVGVGARQCQRTAAGLGQAART